MQENGRRRPKPYGRKVREISILPRDYDEVDSVLSYWESLSQEKIAAFVKKSDQDMDMEKWE